VYTGRVWDALNELDYQQPVFEKTCEATQKNVKSHVSLDFEKKR